MTETTPSARVPSRSWQIDVLMQADRLDGQLARARDNPGAPHAQVLIESRAAELIAAAARVFARHGFHGASVEEIAREAGATTGALYSNFAGKEDLFLALFERSAAGDVHEYAQSFAAGATT